MTLIKKAMLDTNFPLLIAETALNHEYEMNYFKRMIYELSTKTKIKAIKTHMMIDLDTYMIKSHSLYDWLKHNKMTESQYKELFIESKKHGLENIVLLDDYASIDVALNFTNLIDAVEIHAVSINDIHMLRDIIKFDIPIIVGIGGTRIDDILYALEYLKGKDILLMYGYQNFPTNYNYINLNRIPKLRQLFDLPIGYADHCLFDDENNEMVTLGGYMTGCNIIEKHFTLDYGVKRIDYESAISIDMLNSLHNRMQILAKAKGTDSLILNNYENIYGKIGPMKKTFVASKDILAGEEINFLNMSYKRTGEINYLGQSQIDHIIGKIAKYDIKKDEIINLEKIYWEA